MSSLSILYASYRFNNGSDTVLASFLALVERGKPVFKGQLYRRNEFVCFVG
jgi:hypothetical protein